MIFNTSILGLVGTLAGSSQIATGTVTAAKTGSGLSYTHSLEVSGLSFTPQDVVLVRTTAIAYNVAQYFWGTKGHYCNTNGSLTKEWTRTFTADGFRLEYIDSQMFSGRPDGDYYWVAWG